MKVMSIFGTRPEMIKMWGTLKKLDELNFEHIMVHTGQNFIPELKDFFFQDLQLRKPDYELGPLRPCQRYVRRAGQALD